MSDIKVRSLERARQLDPAAEAAHVQAHLRAGGRDPRQDPQPEDVVDAPGPGKRLHAYPGSHRGFTGRRETGSGPMCRERGRKVRALWPQVTVAEVEGTIDDGDLPARRGERVVIPAGARVARGTYYSDHRSQTHLCVMWGPMAATVDVVVRGRVETRVPPDRRDGQAPDYEVEWVPVLYPEVSDEAEVQAALRALESRLTPAELAELRRKVERAPRTTGDLSAVHFGSSTVEHINAWRRWAKDGTVRRIGGTT